MTKFTIATEELKGALAVIANIPEKKDLESIESNFQFERIEDNVVAITAINNVIDATVKLNIMEEEGEWPSVSIGDLVFKGFNINAELFLKAMRALVASKSEVIKIEVDDNNIVLKASRRKIKIPYMLPERSLREFHEGKELSLDILGFKKHLAKTVVSADDNNPKEELNAVAVELGSKTINFVSTDTKKIAVSAVNVEIEEVGQTLVIPKKSISFLNKAIDMNPDNAKILYSDYNIGIISEKMEIFTKLISGKYVDYKRIIPKNLDYVVEIDKYELVEVLKEISYLSSIVSIDIKENEVIFGTIKETENTMVPEANIPIENISITGDFKENKIHVYLKNILPFIQNIESDKVYLGYKHNNPPFKISGESEEKYLQIVMPLTV